MIDDKSFFHQGTMTICGSLDENRMIRDCEKYLQLFMPVEGIMLSTYEQGSRSIRIFAHSPALPVPGGLRSIFLSPESQAFIHQETENGVIIHSRKHSNPVSEDIDRALGISAFSEMVLHLKIDQEKLGVVQLFSNSHSEFTEEHARLLHLLHDPFAVALANVLRHREVLRLKDLLADDNRYLLQELRQTSGNEIVGARYGLLEVMEQVRQAAPLNCLVMLGGETGVGKEVIANAIHYSSPRSEGPFIKVNCGAFSENLLDSELFGHEKGAFTGAVKSKRGRFARAHQGTLFLDEVGELAPAAQVRLLRVLQDGYIDPVGSTDSIKVDVRIIAATHRDLQQMVKEGLFREDLWFRLNVFPIQIPPLRERKTDIPAFVHHFIERKLKAFNLVEHPSISHDTMEMLINYAWPGNVRELENIVERALIQHQGKQGAKLAFPRLTANGSVESTASHPHNDTGEFISLDEAMRRHIQSVLKATHGKIQGKDGAADILEIHPNTLRSRMKKLGMVTC